MDLLHEKIRKDGKVFAGNILKVDSFLNHQIDVQFMNTLGEEIARRFSSDGVTKVLTVEASGIALAVAAAMELGNLPVVFAKKSENKVQTGDVATAPVYSFTHKKEYNIRVEKRYVPRGSRVLIIDDFLADGKAVEGMTQLCQQLDSEVVGIGIAVEKGFQPGGQQLRARGIHLKSLAIVTGIENGKIQLLND